MLLPRSDTALSDCREHLQAFPDTDPAIAAYLARHVAVVLCAEIEQAVTSLIVERVNRGCDQASRGFVRSVRKNLVRNARPGEVADTLKLFGEACHGTYESRINLDLGDEGRGRLGTIVTGRDSTAHAAPIDITFAELETAFSYAVKMVAAVEEALRGPVPLADEASQG